jgi:hypothetical protein
VIEEKESEELDILALVFDRYDTLKPSLKQQTWDSRAKQQPVQYNLTSKTIIKNIKLSELLSHPLNKQRLCEVFAQLSIKRLTDLGGRFVVGYGTKIVSNITGWTRKHHDHDEADTLIVCVAGEIARLNQSNSEFSVKILSPDTDVLMLAINYCVMCVPGCRIIFELPCGKNRRELNVDAIVNKLGEHKAKGLLGANVCTGCDQICKFNSITKARALAVFLDCPMNIVNGLSQLGDELNAVSDGTLDAVTRYVRKEKGR